MNLSRTVAPSLAWLLVAALAQAQEPDLQPKLYSVSLDHPADITYPVTGDAKAVVLGQLSDDPIPDAAILHGSEVHMLYAADRRNCWSKITGNYTAIALLPDARGTSQDSVLAIGSTGLVRLTWNGASGVRTLLPSSQAGTGAWAGASSLQVVQTPGGGYEILAISPNGKSILRAIWTPGSSLITILSQINVSPLATTLRAVQWNTDLNLEYAVANSAGLRVFNAAGTQLPGVTETCSGSMLLTLPGGGGALPDSLLWVRTPAGGSELLTVVHDTGTQEAPISFYGLDAAHMVLVDLGEDVRPELLLVMNHFGLAFGLRRTSGGDTFQGLPSFLVNLEQSRSAVRTLMSGYTDGLDAIGSGAYGPQNAVGIAPVPAVCDMDGDGDDDLFVAGHPGLADRALVYFGAVEDEEALLDDPAHTRAWAPEYDYVYDSNTHSALLDFELTYDPNSGMADDATHMQVAAWTQDVPGQYMDRQALAVLRMSLDPNHPPTQTTIQVPNVNLPAGNRVLIHLEFSFVQLNPGTGEMVRAFPAYHETVSYLALAATPQVSFIDKSLYDGSTVGGSNNRPPTTPPSGGGGGTPTP